MAETWKQLAQDNFDAATELVLRGHLRSAVSRSYYAVYSRLAGVLADVGVSMPKKRMGPSHAKLPVLVDENLRMWSRDRRRRVYEMIQAMYTQRLNADYLPTAKIQQSDARSSLMMMHQVFTLVKKEVR